MVTMKHGPVIVLALVLLSIVFGGFAYFVQLNTQRSIALPSEDQILQPIMPRDMSKFHEEPPIEIPQPIEIEEIIEEPTTPECPSGATTDRNLCNAGCDNGICLQVSSPGNLICVQCQQCPSETFTDKAACEEGNHQGCRVHSTSGAIQCWERLASCKIPCEKNGLSDTEIDFSKEIEVQINATSCVSLYQIPSIKAQVGNCDCYDTTPPVVMFDRTPPVCRDTACGDIRCGESKECQNEAGETITADCQWNGWEKESRYKFRPLFNSK